MFAGPAISRTKLDQQLFVSICTFVNSVTVLTNCVIFFTAIHSSLRRASSVNRSDSTYDLLSKNNSNESFKLIILHLACRSTKVLYRCKNKSRKLRGNQQIDEITEGNKSRSGSRPYFFGVGLVTTLLSKEIWVVDHGFAEVIGFFGAIWLLSNKVGAGMAKWLDNKNDLVNKERFEQPIVDAKASAQEIIANNEKAIWQEDGQKFLWMAKKENVALQLESVYRQRLAQVFKDVKSRLDYQLEVQNVKRRFEQTHMVNWIVDNVTKSITPQQEQESIKVCIAQLKKMSVPVATA